MPDRHIEISVRHPEMAIRHPEMTVRHPELVSGSAPTNSTTLFLFLQQLKIQCILTE